MAEPALGDKIAHFRLLTKLGEGGMGVVYVAEDEKLGRDVALKLLRAEVAREQERRARFLREARLAAAITHPCIATVFEADEVDGRAYIAMELLRGKTLRALIDDHPKGLGAIESLRIAKEIARGLTVAHEAGIVHRDLKPDNVVVEDDGIVKILDFGIAKAVEATDRDAGADSTELATREGSVLGTPAYMSPEQALGGAVDARSDLFSFGVVLFEMLTGERPFNGKSWQEIIVAISRDAAPRVRERAPEVPVEIERVVERCLEKKPADRFASARQLADALGGGGTTASSISNARTAVGTAPPRRSSSAPLIAAGIAIAAIGVTIVAWRGATTAGGEPHAASAAPTTGAPAPKTTPEAFDLYVRGMQDLRDASIARATQELQRAVEIDPGLAAANVRLLYFGTIVGTRESEARTFQAANQHRASLSERDLGLLLALEPMYARSPPDRAERTRRLEALAAKYPKDPEVALDLARALLSDDRLEPARKEAERALALDPKLATAEWVLSDVAGEAGDVEGSLAAADRCLGISPSAASCLRMRASVEIANGNCKALEIDARRMIDVEPNGSRSHEYLARALAANGAPPEVISRAWSGYLRELDAASRPIQEIRGRAYVAALTGDFVEVEKQARAAVTMAADVTAEGAHGALVGLALLADEEGDPARAGEIAKSYLEQRRGWIADGSGDGGIALMLAYRGGKITKDERDAAREKWIAEYRSQHSHREGNGAWQTAYAEAARTEGEAREALAALPSFEPLPSTVIDGFGEIASEGRVLALAGRADEALPLLETATKSCVALDQVFTYPQSFFYLGVAKETKGDRAGACAAYGEVVRRWGAAAPKSVTADEARRRQKKLGC